jgi:hypothetical protein
VIQDKDENNSGDASPRTAVRTVSAGIPLCALTDDMPASKMMMQKKIRFIVLCSQFQLLSAA